MVDNSRTRLGDNWERAVVSSLSSYFQSRGVKIPIIRPRVIPCADYAQFDILTDVVDYKYRIALECKSFSSDFLPYSVSCSGDSQIVRQTMYLEETCRRGYMVILYRGVRNEGYLLPWDVVLSHVGLGGMNINSLRNEGVALVKCGSEYLIPDDVEL